MNVVVYTTPTCSFCYQTKQFLTHRGVPFVEKNVAADPYAAMEMVRLSGQQGVPVTTIDGEVVIGFNPPRLMELLSRTKPKLGATVADAASQARSHPGLPNAGAYVGGIKPGTPAERAGLRRGDVIKAVAGTPIQDAGELHRVIGSLPVGHEVVLAYVRDGHQFETRVRL